VVSFPTTSVHNSTFSNMAIKDLKKKYIAWLFIDNTAIFLGGKSISSFHMLVRQQLETNCMIGFPIYHILLTIYFKLKGNKK